MKAWQQQQHQRDQGYQQQHQQQPQQQHHHSSEQHYQAETDLITSYLNAQAQHQRQYQQRYQQQDSGGGGQGYGHIPPPPLLPGDGEEGWRERESPSGRLDVTLINHGSINAFYFKEILQVSEAEASHSPIINE